jgi:hypothetical protein
MRDQRRRVLPRKLLSCAATAIIGAAPAYAADVTITTDRNTPVETATANAGQPANVFVGSGGSVSIDLGAALTLNSDNTINIDGTVTSENDDNVTGILVRAGVTGTVVNDGYISLIEDFTPSDTDSDGDLDGAIAIGTNRIGIDVAGAGVFTGAIETVKNSTIFIEGNGSVAIRIGAEMTGSVATNGTLNVYGEDAAGLLLANKLTGSMALDGTITATGQGASGVVVLSEVTGAVKIGAVVNVNGFRSQYRTTDTAALDKLDADDLLLSGAAISIQNSVGGGVLIRGTGVEDDLDDDQDGKLDDPNENGTVDDGEDDDDDTTASITVAGSSPALYVGPGDGTQAITLGAGWDGYGLAILGSVTANGTYDGFAATAVSVTGGAASATYVEKGIVIDRAIAASAYEANAVALRLGDNAATPVVLNRGTIQSSSVSETAATVDGILVAAGASLPSVRNMQTISTALYGETGSVYAIRDLSGTVNLIENSGTILTTAIATDDDEEDDVTPEFTGERVAIDLSANASGVTIRQLADTPFSDLDSDDLDEDYRPATTIVGEVRLGAGDDLVDLQAGSLYGDIDFGAGNAVLKLSGGAIFDGAIASATGAVTLDVADGEYVAAEGETRIEKAYIGGDAVVTIRIGDAAGDSAHIVASDSVSIAQGAKFKPKFTSSIPNAGTTTFLTAGSLTGAGSVVGALDGDGYSYLYTVDVVQPSSDSLAFEYRRKTVSELELSNNHGAAYESLVVAMRTDESAGDAFTAIDNTGDLTSAIDATLPKFSTLVADAASNAIHQSVRAASRRTPPPAGRKSAGQAFWLQEVGFILDQSETLYGGLYSGTGFGFAGGFDVIATNTFVLGAAVSFNVASADDQDLWDEARVVQSAAYASLYAGVNTGPVHWTAAAGVGSGSVDSKRRTQIGWVREDGDDDGDGVENETVSAAYQAEVASAAWGNTQFYSSLQVEAPMALTDWFGVNPRAGMTYTSIVEDGYEETGESEALNLIVGGATTTRLVADAGMDVKFSWGGKEFNISQALSAGWRQTLSESADDLIVRYAGGGAPFALSRAKGEEGAMFVGAGLDIVSKLGVTFVLAYEAELQDAADTYNVNATLRWTY